MISSFIRHKCQMRGGEMVNRIQDSSNLLAVLEPSSSESLYLFNKIRVNRYLNVSRCINE